MTGAASNQKLERILDVDVQLPLDRFDLNVTFATRHRVTGVFGVSGSGKTSLLEVIAGIRTNARGKIRHGDQAWLDSTARRRLSPEHRNIGYVPQDGLLFPNLTVRGNLMSGRDRALRRGLPVDDVMATVTDILELGSLLDRQVTMLSGGERQRVALGRAICSGPSLMLLDEPLAALDLPLRRRLLPFLRRLNEEFEIPSILVSHDPIEVQALCGDLIVLHEGKMIARGKPSEVLTDTTVYSVAERDGFENVLPGILLESNRGTSRFRLLDTEPAIELIVGSPPGSPRQRLFLGLPARDIMISNMRPEGLSARNVLPATILALRDVGNAELITVSLGANAPQLTVEVTLATIEQLNLEVDRQVFLVFKATSCRLYGDHLGV